MSLSPHEIRMDKNVDEIRRNMQYLMGRVQQLELTLQKRVLPTFDKADQFLEQWRITDAKVDRVLAMLSHSKVNIQL